MKHRSHYAKLAAFCWSRAHKAMTPVARSFWFDRFEVADAFSHIVG